MPLAYKIPQKLWRRDTENTRTRTDGINADAIPDLLVAQRPSESHDGALGARAVRGGRGGRLTGFTEAQVMMVSPQSHVREGGHWY